MGKSKKYPTPESALFAYVAPEGIVYCDRRQEEYGDYKKVAFLSFRTLELSLYNPRADLLPLITSGAARLQAQKGQEYQVSGAGQSVILGWGL